LFFTWEFINGFFEGVYGVGFGGLGHTSGVIEVLFLHRYTVLGIGVLITAEYVDFINGMWTGRENKHLTRAKTLFTPIAYYKKSGVKFHFLRLQGEQGLQLA